MDDYENRPEGFPERDRELERGIIKGWARQIVSPQTLSIKQAIPFFFPKSTAEERSDQLISDLRERYPAGERISGRDGRGYVCTGEATVNLVRMDVFIHVAAPGGGTQPLSVRDIDNSQLPIELRTRGKERAKD